MTDTSNPLTALSGFFFGNDKNDPRVNPQLRQRIALAMMVRGTKYPKTFGEGLSAIGEAIGDRGMQRMLEQQDLAQQGITPPPAGAGPAQGTPYAPPSDDLANAPAVKAIDAATSQPQVIPPPAPPPGPMTAVPSELTATPSAQQPASMLDPAPMLNKPIQTPPATGFNKVPTAPGAVPVVAQDEANALDENIDPTFARRRAIAGIESGGAKDPYSLLGAQTRTGDRAYGKYQVMGANVPEWTQAALGRSLTPQQFLADKDAQDATFDNRFGGYANKYGEEGAAKAWYAGEGGMKNPNATDQHGRLTVRSYGQDFLNRLNGGQTPATKEVWDSSGDAAANARREEIKTYNQLVGPQAGNSPRDAVALALLNQNSNPPVMAQGGDDPSLLSAAAPSQQQALAFSNTGSGIRAAPPFPPGIRAAPQQQAAQAQPQAIPGYVPPEAKDPSAAPIIGMKPREVELRNWLVQNQNNPYAAPKVAAELQQLEQERTIRQNEANELYKANIARATSQNDMREKALMDQPTRQGAAAKAAAEAEIYKRTGQSPEQFYPEMDKQKASAEQAVKAQDAQQLARKAIRAGVVTGYGASGITASDKFAEWAFNNGMRGDRAANTEIMGAALKFGLTDAIETINGVGGKVSDSDLKIAQGIQATDPNLQMKTIKTIMDRAAEINNMKVDRYEQKVSTYLGGHPQELNYATNARPVAPPEKLKLLLDSQADPEKAATMKSHFDEVYGPGAANLEISRFKRAQSRTGK